jgi:hypothetical protein
MSKLNVGLAAFVMGEGRIDGNEWEKKRKESRGNKEAESG